MEGDSMNREIKFRVWDKTVGDYVKLLSIDFKNKTAIVEHWEFGVSNPMSLDDLVIERYTGLKDCYGNVIYENDLLKFTYPFDKNSTIGQVEWSDKDAGFILGISTLWRIAIKAEVVGNAHEDGQLLGADK